MHALKLPLDLLAFLSVHARTLEVPCMRLSCSSICWHFLACMRARWRVVHLRSSGTSKLHTHKMAHKMVHTWHTHKMAHTQNVQNVLSSVDYESLRPPR